MKRIWFNPEDWKELERAARKHGMTVQEFADHAVRQRGQQVEPSCFR
jgi:hypothetical protein